MNQMPSTAIMQTIGPFTQRAIRLIDGGAPVGYVLQESMMTGYLMGRGMPPAQALEAVQSMARPVVAADQMGGFIQAIEKAIQDQANATVFYGELASRTTDPALRDYINHAREDEQKHYRMLNTLHLQLTGRPFDAQPQPTPFTDLRQGLKKAMDDEYEAFEEYRTLYLSQSDQRIRDLLFEIMTDELEHATRFNYVLQSL